LINRKFIQEVGFIKWLFRYSLYQFYKRILKTDILLRLPTGIRMVLPRTSQNSAEVFVTNANMDWGSEALFARFAKPHNDFLDIGSHVGYYALYLSPLVRRVYAFEPASSNLPALLNNAKFKNNIEVINSAVSCLDGTRNFYTGGGSAVGSLNNVGGEVTEVKVCSIDTFVKAHPMIVVSVIKIDIEGHDLEVLRGAHLTVEKFQPLILTECAISEELFTLSLNWKYKTYAFTRSGSKRSLAFREIRPCELVNYNYKMVFLVPRSLQNEFENIT